MGLFLFVDEEMTSPSPDTPTLPGVGSDYSMRWRASDLVATYADGASLTAWVATGSAALPDRSLTSLSAGWTRPLVRHVGSSGRPVVEFNLVHQLSSAVGSNTESPQPVAYTIKGKLTAETQGALARLVSGTSGFLNTIRPIGADTVRINSGGGDQNVIVGDLTEDFILTVQLDGDDSILKFNNEPPQNIPNPGTNPYKLISIGAPAGQPAASTGLAGEYEELRVFLGKRFTASQLADLHDNIAAEYT